MFADKLFFIFVVISMTFTNVTARPSNTANNVQPSKSKLSSLFKWFDWKQMYKNYLTPGGKIVWDSKKKPSESDKVHAVTTKPNTPSLNSVSTAESTSKSEYVPLKASTPTQRSSLYSESDTASVYVPPPDYYPPGASNPEFPIPTDQKNGAPQFYIGPTHTATMPKPTPIKPKPTPKSKPKRGRFAPALDNTALNWYYMTGCNPCGDVSCDCDCDCDCELDC